MMVLEPAPKLIRPLLPPHPWVLCSQPVPCSRLCLQTSQAPFNIQPKYCHRGEDSEVSAPPKAPHPHSLVQSVLYGLGTETYSTGNSAPCYVAAWMGGGFDGERIHIYVWLSLFAVHLNLLQHCIITIESNPACFH